MKLIRDSVFMVIGVILGEVSLFMPDTGSGDSDIADRKRNEIFMPLFSAIMSTVALVGCCTLKEILRKLAQWSLVKQWLPEGGWETMPDLVAGISGVSCFIFLYRVAKKNFAPHIIRCGKEFNFVHDEFAGIYIKDERFGGYRLAERWCLVRSCMQCMIVFDAVFLTVLYHGILWGKGAHSIRDITLLEILPLIGFLILLECFYFLECREMRTGRRKKFSDNHSLDLARLKSCYDKENSFGLAAPVVINTNHFRMKDESEKTIDECFEDENPHIKYFSYYLSRKCRQEKHHYHPHFIDVAMRLIRGQNIFLASSFYRDADICIFFPIYLALIKGEHVLILAEDNEDLNTLKDWIKSGIEDVHGLKDLWNVGILGQFVIDVEVGILSFQELYQRNTVRWIADFLKTVSFVVILQPTNMVAGGQEELSFVAAKIGTAVQNCVFLLFDRNTEGALDLFSHLFNTTFHYVSATPMVPLKYLTAYWNVEQEPHRIWDPVRRYLGLELRIAEIAWTESVQKVVWYGEDAVPVRDLQWIIGQYYEMYGKKTSRSPHQVSVNRDLQCGVFGLNCEAAREQFLILEDSDYNLLEVRRQFITRAKEKLVLHILSPNYMLRNYMRSEENEAVWDAKYISQFAPEHVGSVRNTAIYLIRKMLNEPVSEDEVCERLKKCEEYSAGEGTEEQVKTLICLVMNVTDPQIKVTFQYRYSESYSGVVQKKFYQIMDEQLKNDFSEYFQRACYIDENGQEKKISRLILAGHLDQKYLPGQLVTFGGIYYEITGKIVKDAMTALEVERASDQISGRKFYRQCRRYKVSSSSGYSDLETWETDALRISRTWKDITVETDGYLSMGSLNDIASGHPIQMMNSEVSIRQYREKQVLKIEFLAIPEEDKAVVCLFGILLHEVFCTLYPQYYHLLSVALHQQDYQGLYEEKILKYVLSDIDDTSKNCLFILEDSREDMGLLRSVERNFNKIKDILLDYMKWSVANSDDYLNFGYADSCATLDGRGDGMNGNGNL